MIKYFQGWTLEKVTVKNSFNFFKNLFSKDGDVLRKGEEEMSAKIWKKLEKGKRWKKKYNETKCYSFIWFWAFIQNQTGLNPPSQPYLCLRPRLEGLNHPSQPYFCLRPRLEELWSQHVLFTNRPDRDDESRPFCPA